MTGTDEQSEYVLRSTAAESERLELQAALYGGASFLERFVDSSPARVLEVGCGTGAFVRHLAERLPESRILGVDLDESRLALAREQAAGLGNAELVPGRMERLPFAAGSFDLVYCRFVLVHAPDPQQAVREMVRVARSGGVVLVYDMVHSGVWFSPPRPAFAELLSHTCEVMRERGMEPDQGLHLGPALLRAGLREVAVQSLPVCLLAGDPLFEAHRRNWVETVDSLEQLLSHRFGREGIDAALTELRDESAFQSLLETTVMAWGTKR